MVLYWRRYGRAGGCQDFSLGGVAQVGERLPCKEEARGSSPLISTRISERFLGLTGRSKTERSLKEDRKNVDNRIQYVGQIESEGKHSRKKNQSQDINRVKKERVRKKDLFLTSREKLLRAYGGCLGAECRRRTWDTAKSPGEL